jgi:hypothetical protein
VAGYTFRARRVFTLEELTGLEGVYVEDLDPASPVIGQGSGVVCLVGEFDDGPINQLTEIEGGDLTRQFGGLGFTYGGVPSCNPCARRRGGELWNGNGFIYSRYIKAPRFLVVRVDASVGEVAFSPLAVLPGGRGPWPLNAGDTLSITSSDGTASTPAVAATAATLAGASAISSTGFTGGEQIKIQLDDTSAPIVVTFSAADQTAPAVAARINGAAGAVIATEASGTLTLRSLQLGSGGKLTVSDVSAGALTALKLTAGTSQGTGNVANLSIATPTELAAIINGASALSTLGIKASVGEDGTLRLYDASAGDGTIAVAAGAFATKLGLPTGTTVKAGQHLGGVIKAGTRVRTAGGAEWVTMESITVAPGTNAAPNLGPHRVKVRPAFDDGTAAGSAADTAVVLVDQPGFATFQVGNQAALGAALTEGQLDAAYLAAIDQTLDSAGPGVDINYLYCARRSYAIDVYAADKTEVASNSGCAGRKYIRSGALGLTSKQQAKDDANKLRSDRVWYAWPGWQVVIPEILRRGAAGGLGFRDDGVVNVRGAGPLVKISALLPPEENPGQQTGLITNFFATEPLGFVLTPDDYRDLKASGICAPRVDRTAGSIYQSGITTDLTKARQSQARRKMADHIQDGLARTLVRFSKKLMTEGRKDAAVSAVDSFLSGLLSRQDPERQRIADYLIDLSFNTPDTEALGIYVIRTLARTLSSFDAIELRTEIGEGVVTIAEISG